MNQMPNRTLRIVGYLTGSALAILAISYLTYHALNYLSYRNLQHPLKPVKPAINVSVLDDKPMVADEPSSPLDDKSMVADEPSFPVDNEPMIADEPSSPSTDVVQPATPDAVGSSREETAQSKGDDSSSIISTHPDTEYWLQHFKSKGIEIPDNLLEQILRGNYPRIGGYFDSDRVLTDVDIDYIDGKPRLHFYLRAAHLVEAGK